MLVFVLVTTKRLYMVLRRSVGRSVGRSGDRSVGGYICKQLSFRPTRSDGALYTALFVVDDASCLLMTLGVCVVVVVFDVVFVVVVQTPPPIPPSALRRSQSDPNFRDLKKCRKFCPVGRLLPGVKLSIMKSETLDAQPVGVSGEIYVGGPTLALGSD